MPKLYALFVAINKYAPQSGVSDLEGCENDIKEMQQFIEDHYAELSPDIVKLVNEAATRENIINTFQSHLIKNAVAGDTILFYYSGHGSYSKSATELEHYDTRKKDETLVCYDSRLQGNYDLADKELAVLLSRVTDEVHTIVIVDACYSGSITKSVADDFELGKKRFAPGRIADTPRPLNAYLLEGDDYYPDLQKEGKKIAVPESKHLSLSACGRGETAREFEAKGIFTAALLEVLQQNRQLSYLDIFTKVRQQVRQQAKRQNPELDPRGSFNTNAVFLRAGLQGNAQGHLLSFVNDEWRLDYGAIHGMPTDAYSISQLKIGVFEELKTLEVDEPREAKYIGSASLRKVLLQESILDFEMGETTSMYKGVIQNWPSALLLRLEGTPELKADFLSKYKKHASPFLLLDEETAAAKYTLLIKEDELLIQRSEGAELIHGVETRTPAAVIYIKEILERIEEWERVIDLQNPGTRLKGLIEMTFREEATKSEMESFKVEDHFTVDYFKEGEDKDANDNLKTVDYSIKFKNTSSRKLHIALLHLGSDFQMNAFYDCNEINPGDEVTLEGEEGPGFFVDFSEWNEVTDVFKLLVSTESFITSKFEQEGFELDKVVKVPKQARGVKGVKQRKSESDWCTHTLWVNTIRRDQSISEQSITFEEEGLIINGHPSFSANVAFAPINTNLQSVHPIAALADIFRDSDLKLLNLSSNTRSLADKTIIEFSDLLGEATLKEHALEIELLQKLEDSEQIIPVAFDGDFIIPFGKSLKSEDGKTRIVINEMPVVPDPYGRKSAGRALWFCFLKVTFFRNLAFLLRHAYLSYKGEVIRKTKGVQEKVANAQKILLVIHGIIGDTKTMAKNLMFLVDPKDEKKYDLMLTFDYENLNEPIEDIAKELNKQLEKIGLGADDEKQVDVIAHSMGGLVSRHLIEVIRKGDSLVDRLIMFGTPNGGSPFGDIPGYIEMFSTLVTVAINFGKILIPPLLAHLEILEKANAILENTKYITVTLDQMNVESDFTKALAKNNPAATRYIIIAGDISQYSPEMDHLFHKFKERVLIDLGNTVNYRLPNDIAVAVDKIQEVPDAFEATTYVITGHHLNYFEEGEAMRLLREII